MKKVSCKSVKGPEECTHVFEVEDFDGFMKQAKEHFGSTHKEIIESASDEDKEKWVAMAKGVVEGTPVE